MVLRVEVSYNILLEVVILIFRIHRAVAMRLEIRNISVTLTPLLIKKLRSTLKRVILMLMLISGTHIHM